MELLTVFAATEQAAGKTSLFGALGLDIKQLIINVVAFLILLAILRRFVYPTLIASIDSRRELIESSVAEAKKSQEAGEKAEQRINELLSGARKEADDIVARSQTEAQAMVSEAETKARERAEQIVKDARSQLDSEIVKARAVLKKDTLGLVALATEKIINKKLDATQDSRLIEELIGDTAAIESASVARAKART